MTRRNHRFRSPWVNSSCASSEARRAEQKARSELSVGSVRIIYSPKYERNGMKWLPAIDWNDCAQSIEMVARKGLKWLRAIDWNDCSQRTQINDCAQRNQSIVCLHVLVAIPARTARCPRSTLAIQRVLVLTNQKSQLISSFSRITLRHSWTIGKWVRDRSHAMVCPAVDAVGKREKGTPVAIPSVATTAASNARDPILLHSTQDTNRRESVT
jgi:hypothetical protein